MNHKELFEATEKIVSPVVMVGGCVRDLLLNIEPYDYDFATPLSPLAVEEKIRAAGRRPYLIGNRFGTVGVKVPIENEIATLDSNGQPHTQKSCEYHLVEITTYRTETYEDGSRKPNVSYVSSLDEDLSRRDFTVNAMAMKSNGEIIDPFDGQVDLENRILRCVGKPKHRFKEDPLRMLRAARFASKLGFEIHESIYEATEEMNHKILEVSKERWMMELDKLLTTDNPRPGLEFMFKTRLMNFMLPEIGLQYEYCQDNPHHGHFLHEHTILVIENTIPDPYMRWAALLHDVGKPFVKQYKDNPPRSVYYKHEYLGAEFVDKIGKHLKWSNDRLNLVSDMVLNHMKEDSPLYDADTKAK
jgi:putative nucleotidyltransferase with HDIG domain